MNDVTRAIRRTVLFSLVALLAAGGTTRAQDAPAETEETPAGPRVAEAAVCTAIEERAPVGAGTTFPAGTERLFCFSDLRDASGLTVVHTWIHEGTTRARVELEVGGDRWRTWSSKQLLPEWTGSWQVKIMTADGAVLETLDFTVE